MPGDSPHVAYEAFIAPLQRAISCLCNGKIVATTGGKDRPGVTHSWSLNALQGMVASGGLHFQASMHYQIMQDDRDGYGPYRVTTQAYAYQYSVLGHPLFRIRWHPKGNSPVVHPHAHIAFHVPDDRARPPRIEINTLKAHLPCPRMTLEDAIYWAIQLGWPSETEEYEEVLRECVKAHLKYRSWDIGPVGEPYF